MGGTGSPQSSNSIARLGDVLFGVDRHVINWVGQRIPLYQSSEDARALGIVRHRKLVAGVVYERWNGVHCEASIAADPGSAWASRQTLHTIFFYPFQTLDCKAISVLVPETNLKSLNLATKLGFEGEAIVRYAAHDGSDLLVLKMFRENCEWIHQDGQRRKQSPTSTGSA